MTMKILFYIDLQFFYPHAVFIATGIGFRIETFENTVTCRLSICFKQISEVAFSTFQATTLIVLNAGGVRLFS